MKQVMKAASLIIGLLAAWTPVHGQDLPDADSGRDEYETQLKLDPEFHAIEGIKQEFLYDYGAFFRSSFVNFRSTQDNWIALQTHQLRAWSRLHVGDNYEAYLRFKTSRTMYRSGDTPSGDHSRRDKPKLDLGYISYGRKKGSRFGWTLGRYYVSAGQGLALAKRLDGLRIRAKVKNGRILAYSGRAPNSDNHPNGAFPDGSKSDIRATGFQYSSRHMSRHEPYIGRIWTTDNTNETPINLEQDFNQHLEFTYYGIRGQIDADTRYVIEEIRGGGRVSRFGYAGEIEDRVRSRALLVGLQRVLPDDQGLLSFDYKQGTGDSSRTSVTSVGTTSSNRSGPIDRNFFYYGYTDTGLLYAPRLTNLDLWHGGLVWNQKGLEDHEFKLDFFKYYREKASGSVSDTTTTRRNHDLGSEWDLGWQYRPYGNAALVVRWGRFMPGDAYLLRQPRDIWRFDFFLDF